MEEIDRFEVISPSLNGYACIEDFKTDNVLNTYDSCDLLNQQEKRIKELEEENQQLKQQLTEKDKRIEILSKQNKALIEEEDLLDKKLKELGVDCIEDLGKSQNQKAIEQLEEVKELFQYCWWSKINVYRFYDKFLIELDQQINELKWKVEDEKEN